MPYIVHPPKLAMSGGISREAAITARPNERLLTMTWPGEASCRAVDAALAHAGLV